MSDFAQIVKQQADIVKVIEGYIRLRKAGAQRLLGAVPVPQREDRRRSACSGAAVFHCFGCQASGDVFSFVGKIENVGFPEAVRIVAQKCGIPLPKQEYSSPEEAAGARLRASCWNCTRPRPRGLKSSCAGRKVRWRANILRAAGLTAGGNQEIPHRLCAGQL